MFEDTGCQRNNSKALVFVYYTKGPAFELFLLRQEAKMVICIRRKKTSTKVNIDCEMVMLSEVSNTEYQYDHFVQLQQLYDK